MFVGQFSSLYEMMGRRIGFQEKGDSDQNGRIENDQNVQLGWYNFWAGEPLGRDRPSDSDMREDWVGLDIARGDLTVASESMNAEAPRNPGLGQGVSRPDPHDSASTGEAR